MGVVELENSLDQNVSHQRVGHVAGVFLLLVSDQGVHAVADGPSKVSVKSRLIGLRFI